MYIQPVIGGLILSGIKTYHLTNYDLKRRDVYYIEVDEDSNNQLKVEHQQVEATESCLTSGILKISRQFLIMVNDLFFRRHYFTSSQSPS